MPFRFWATSDNGNPDKWGENPRPDWAYQMPWLGRYWYCAYRNPVGGLDRIFQDTDEYNTYGTWLETEMEPKDLIAAGQLSGLRWRTYKWMDGIRYVKLNWPDPTYREHWLGFKIGSPVKGLGFTFQNRFRRPIPKRQLGEYDELENK